MGKRTQKSYEERGFLGKIFFRIFQGIMGIIFYLAARENAKDLEKDHRE